MGCFVNVNVRPPGPFPAWTRAREVIHVPSPIDLYGALWCEFRRNAGVDQLSIVPIEHHGPKKAVRADAFAVFLLRLAEVEHLSVRLEVPPLTRPPHPRHDHAHREPAPAERPTSSPAPSSSLAGGGGGRAHRVNRTARVASVSGLEPRPPGGATALAEAAHEAPVARGAMPVISRATRIISHLTRAILLATRVARHPTRVISLLTRIISRATRVILPLTRVTLLATGVIPRVPRFLGDASEVAPGRCRCTERSATRVSRDWTRFFPQPWSWACVPDPPSRSQTGVSR